jgi:Flp pilus assembly protein TadG
MGRFDASPRCEGLKAIADIKGSTSTIFALAMFPLMVGVGFAVDYAAANREKARLQAALDSGVLAAAKQTSRVSDPSQIVISFVNAVARRWWFATIS